MEELDPSFVITYAQNREDIILLSFFKDLSKGFYVDVGAGHHEEDSVTKLFYERGWKGINIEPIKRFYDLIEINRPRDINLNFGISDKKGKLIFREYENYGQSTFIVDMKKEYEYSLENMGTHRDYEVHVDTLANVLDKNAVGHINFLKVDVEGLEYSVLSGNNWGKHRPDILCIEANHIIKDWRSLLKLNGYTLVFNDGLNEYYASNEFSRKKRFSYEEAFLGEIRPVDFRVAALVDKEIDTLYSKIGENISKDVDQSLKIDQLEHEVSKLNIKLSNYQRIRPLIKALLTRTSLVIEEYIYPSNYRNQLILPKSETKLTLYNDVYEQLNAINEYDKINLSKIKIASHPIRTYALRGYRKTVHFAIRFIRVGRHIQIKLKKMILER